MADAEMRAAADFELVQRGLDFSLREVEDACARTFEVLRRVSDRVDILVLESIVGPSFEELATESSAGAEETGPAAMDHELKQNLREQSQAITSQQAQLDAAREALAVARAENERVRAFGTDLVEEHESIDAHGFRIKPKQEEATFDEAPRPQVLTSQRIEELPLTPEQAAPGPPQTKRESPQTQSPQAAPAASQSTPRTTPRAKPKFGSAKAPRRETDSTGSPKPPHGDSAVQGAATALATLDDAPARRAGGSFLL